MIKNNENGVTMIMLVVTLIVFLIILSMVVTGGINSSESTKKSKIMDDLQMVKHAVLEQYTKYTLLKDSSVLKGEEVQNMQELKELTSSLGIELIENSRYYKLDKKALNEIGIKSVNDIYIVNYFTGEVLNYTKAEQGEKYYLYGVNANDNIESL